MKLLVVPRARLKPLIQWPRWFRITPPPLALPRFPKAKPSVLSFTHLAGGFCQATGTQILDRWILVFIPMEKNSALLCIHLIARFGLPLPVLKTTSFLWIQICQMLIIKIILHGMPKKLELTSILQFIASHSTKGWLKESTRQRGNFKSTQSSATVLHLRSRWSIDSFSSEQMGQRGLRLKPLEPWIVHVGMLLWRQSQRKKRIFGGASSFHTHNTEFNPGFKGFKSLAKR